jgi:cation transport ATPase
MSHHHDQSRHGASDHGSPARMYVRFGIMLLLSLGLMWVLSMSMVREPGHFILNLSDFYMALIMVAAMGILMLVGMWSMFRSTKANIALLIGFAALLVGAFALGRSEAFVGDRAFLESMIPHHSRAILMCQESSITDPEIDTLCGEIIESQRDEIEQMEQILDRR